MAMRNPKRGDYFLLPFTGPKRDLLVQAQQEYGGWQWWVTYPAYPQRPFSCVLLSSCQRCTPSRAAAILGAKEVPHG